MIPRPRDIPDEVVVRYRVRADQATFAPDAFFFQEGDAAYYEHARCSEFRVAPGGDALLVGVRGPQMEPLGPPP